MTFPTTPLGVTVELQGVVTAGVWSDITNYVYTRDGINISRGRQDESSIAEPSRCQLTLNNRDGRFSPRNPVGTYYGKLGRNTPIRVSVNLGQSRFLAVAANDRAFTPDSVGLSIVGDLDLRVDARMSTWGDTATLLSKFGSAGQLSYALAFTSGYPVLYWSADGTNWLTATATVQLPSMTGRQAVRATLDVDNGAAGRTITFYTAPTMSGTWTQHGAPVVQAGVTSIFNSTSNAHVGIECPAGFECYSAKILQGIAGVERANPDFTLQTSGVTSFADAAGNTWGLTGTPEITNKRTRFIGEVSSWPVSWDVSGQDVSASIEAAGIRRRIGQGAPQFRSAFYRAATGATPAASLEAYWPCEDVEGSTVFAAGLSGVADMTIISGAPTFAADTSSFVASDALPVTNSALMAGLVPAHTSASSKAQVRWLAKIPTGIANGTLVMSVYFVGGTIYRSDLEVNADGTRNMLLYDRSLTLVSSTGFGGSSVLDQQRRYSMEFTQNGANIDYGIVLLSPGATGGVFISSSAAAQTFGTVGSVVFGRGQNMPSTVFGHIMVQSDVTSIFDLSEVLDAYAGEQAGARIVRLCAEEGFAFVDRGQAASSTALGAQGSSTFLALVDEAAAADGGFLVESRTTASLSYRPRRAMCTQRAALTVPYGNLDGLVPTDDDQLARNDITVDRVGGSSSRATLSTGALSTLAPPSGIGRYGDQLSLNLAADSQTLGQASWRLMQGTIDEPRYPTITTDLSYPAMAASSSLTTAALDLDPGDLLVIEDPPAWLPPDDIRQIVQGMRERILPFSFEMEINCSPASAWNVGVYDQGLPATRYGGSGSTLSAGITSTATGAAALSIVTPAGSPLWTTAVGSFPLDILIGGERITLSAIAATASPQSATVSARSANGVVKAHLAGASIEVADSAVYGL